MLLKAGGSCRLFRCMRPKMDLEIFCGSVQIQLLNGAAANALRC